MMLQAFIFENTPNLLEDLTEVKEEIFSDNIVPNVEEVVAAADVIDTLGEQPEEYSESECECVLCKNFNTIKEKWVQWEPEDAIKKILKFHIDSMP